MERFGMIAWENGKIQIPLFKSSMQNRKNKMESKNKKHSYFGWKVSETIL